MIVHFPGEYEMLSSVGVGEKDASYEHSFEVTRMVAAYNKSAEDTTVYSLETITFVEGGTWNATMD